MTISTAPGPRATKWRGSLSDLRSLAGLTALAFVGFSLIRPGGEFPLNDDWAFILPVKWWVEQGRLQFTDWQFMTLIGQVALGAAVSNLAGFSITGLRELSLGLATVSTLLIYVTARATRSTPLASALAALLLICNPIFLVTAASFMTDVPFLAVCLAAIALRVCAQGRRGTVRLVLAWLFVGLACSIRQSGIALALGFIAFDVAQRGYTRRALSDSVLPALIIAMLLAAFPRVVRSTIGLPSMFNQPTDEVKGFLIGLLHLRFGLVLMAFKNLLVTFAYLGLCMAPLLPLIAHGRANWRRPTAALGISALTAIAVIAVGRSVPDPSSTFFDFGLGVRTLPGQEPGTTAPAAFWWAIAFVVGMGAAASVFAAASMDWHRSVVRPSRAADRNAYVAMLVTILFVYNIPFLMRGGIWFDRYTLPNVAFFALLVAPFLELSGRSRTGAAMTSALLLTYFAFGVAGTHDYLEWNRQRWLAADELGKRVGASPSQIDGGFEFNNYQARLPGDHHRPSDSVDIKLPNAPYRLSFSPLPGHTLLAQRHCNTWLFGSPRTIYVLRAP